MLLTHSLLYISLVIEHGPSYRMVSLHQISHACLQDIIRSGTSSKPSSELPATPQPTVCNSALTTCSLQVLGGDFVYKIGRLIERELPLMWS